MKLDDKTGLPVFEADDFKCVDRAWGKRCSIASRATYLMEQFVKARPGIFLMEGSIVDNFFEPDSVHDATHEAYLVGIRKLEGA